MEEQKKPKKRKKKRKDIFDFLIPLPVVFEDYINEDGLRVVSTRRGKFVIRTVGEPSLERIEAAQKIIVNAFFNSLQDHMGYISKDKELIRLLYDVYYQKIFNNEKKANLKMKLVEEYLQSKIDKEDTTEK